MKSDSARVGLKPFLQSGMEGKSQPSDCADTAIPKDHWKAGTGHPGMAQRAHRDYSDPSCQPGENALSSKEWFGVNVPQTTCKGSRNLPQEAAGILSLCFLPLQHHCAAQGLYKTLPTAPRTPLFPGSRQGRCRLYSQDLMAVRKWCHEHDGEHGKTGSQNYCLS